jgi:hypothetical protein
MRRVRRETATTVTIATMAAVRPIRRPRLCLPLGGDELGGDGDTFGLSTTSGWMEIRFGVGEGSGNRAWETEKLERS